MPEEIRLWSVGEGDSLREVVASGLDLEARLEKWLKDDVSVLSADLMVIGSQVETAFGGYIDLLCINPAGDLIVVELKRDKTPREITAQALDYASWVCDLSHDKITEIAASFFGNSDALERNFFEAFGVDLPEALNSEHGMIVVGSAIDDSTERIINYLSEKQGVNINAATFQFYRDDRVGELLGRVFLIEPKDVESRVRRKGSSKRKPNLTYEQLATAADEAGVGNLYREAFSRLNALFSKGTTRSTAGFAASLDGSRNAVVNLLPFESSPDKGLHFQVYSVRLGMHLGVPRGAIEAKLPQPVLPWAYAGIEDPFWHGCTGFFTTEKEIDVFAQYVKSKLDEVASA